MWYEAAEDVTFTVDYMVDGEFVVPTAASYKLRDHTGALLDSGILAVNSTSQEFTILAAHNVVTSESENRYVYVTWVSGGKTYQRSWAYVLGAFIPMTATKDQVRSLLGLDASELTDNELDLYAAYYDLADEYGTDFSESMTATGVKNRLANQAVALKAALSVAHSVPMRTKIQVRTENTTVSRSDKIDFDKLAAGLEKKLATALNGVVTSTVANTALFELSSPTDAVTG